MSATGCTSPVSSTVAFYSGDMGFISRTGNRLSSLRAFILFCAFCSFYIPNTLCPYTPFNLSMEKNQVYEKLYCALNTADRVKSPIKSTSELFLKFIYEFTVFTDTEYPLMDSTLGNMNPIHSFTSHLRTILIFR